MLVSGFEVTVGGRCGEAGHGAEERPGEAAGEGYQGPGVGAQEVQEQEDDEYRQGQQLWVSQPSAHCRYCRNTIIMLLG